MNKEENNLEQDRLNAFMTLVIGSSRSVTRLKGSYMAQYGLGSTHTMCIRTLYEKKDGLTRTQLAEACELDKAQVSRIINELTEKGFVYEGKATSSYKKKIALTEQGIKVAEGINKTVLEINNFVSKDFSKEEIQTFYRVFETICENLKYTEQHFLTEEHK